MKTAYHWMLALGMLVTGSINTLTNKAADNQVVGTVVVGNETRDVKYNHPFVQALCMFIGEVLCLCVYKIGQWYTKCKDSDAVVPKLPCSPFLFAIPAACDMLATSTMYVGLTLTYTSNFQMLRGSVVMFTGAFSVLFLKRKLHKHQWLGMTLVLLGVACVGLADQFKSKTAAEGAAHDAGDVTLGNLLVIAAQVIVAVQMVVEEKLIGNIDIDPLAVVGWEGIWGCTFGSLALILLYFVPQPAIFATDGQPPSAHFEDPILAVKQIAASGLLILFTCGGIVSIAFFNFFGVSITKQINAATRMVLDSLRTMVIWAVSVGLGWEAFGADVSTGMKLLGFIILLLGTAVFNELVKLPCFRYDEYVLLQPVEELSDSEDDDIETTSSPRISKIRSDQISVSDLKFTSIENVLGRK